MKIIHVIFLVFLFIKTSLVFSQEVKITEIKIEGNKRVPASFISNILKDYLDTNIDNTDINDITKKLFMSDYFKDIQITKSKNLLYVKVVEKSVFYDFVFKGNESFTEDELLEIVNISKRDTFNKGKLNQAINNIKTAYSKLGRYFTNIIVNKKELSDGRIRIFFTIEESGLTKVNRINFIGNKFYSDSNLRSVIQTKEARFYRIFGTSLFQDSNIEIDKLKLNKFYLDRGHVDFKILSYRTELKQDYSGFNINIIVDEGIRYKINKIMIENSFSNISNIELNDIKNDMYIERGDVFDQRAVDQSIVVLNDYFGSKGYSFIDINTEIKDKNKDKKSLNLIFKVNEGLKSYVNKININGNTRTLDYVIRRELKLIEGDPFNSQLLKESINSLRRLGYFNSVDVKLSKTEIKNQVDINLTVEEKLTGTFSIGVGYDSVDKAKINIGLDERNFLGKGLKTRLSLQTSESSTRYNIGLTEPYFRDKPLSVSADLFDEVVEQDDKDIDRSGLMIGMGFNRNSYFNNFKYNYSESKTSLSTSSSALSISGEENIEIVTSSVGYSLSKNTTDNFLNPKTGLKFKSSLDLAGVGGDAKFYKFETSYKKYTPFSYGDYVLSLAASGGIIESIDNEKVTSSNRFYFGSSSIRGFDANGIGPRDSGSLAGVGGNKYYKGSFELRSKKFMPEDSGIEWSIYTDLGSLWDTDYPTNVTGANENSARISSGVSLYWNTVAGPLNFIWGWPSEKQDYDKENNFKFSIGTSF